MRTCARKDLAHQMLKMFANTKHPLVRSEVERHGGRGAKLGRKGQAPSFRYTFIEHLLCAVSSGWLHKGESNHTGS